jgi:hypothetical protein
MSMACPQLQHPARECRRLADGSQIGTKIAALLCPLQPRLDDTRQPRGRVKQRIDASIGIDPRPAQFVRRPKKRCGGSVRDNDGRLYKSRRETSMRRHFGL